MSASGSHQLPASALRRRPVCVIGHAPWNDPEQGYVAATHVRERFGKKMKRTWEENSDFEFTLLDPSFLDDNPDLPEADNADDYAFDPYSYAV